MSPSRRSDEPGDPGSLVPMSDSRERLSTLWIVILFNMVFADILSFLNPEFLRGVLTGYAEGIRVTHPLLVGSAVILQVPILMVLLSRVLTPTANRRAHFVAVPLTAAFVIGGGSTYPHYLFLAGVELVCLALILRQVWAGRPSGHPAQL